MAKKSCLAMTEASRCAALAAHSAAGVVVTQLPLLPHAKLQLEEAERLLRGVESLARLATTLLQTLPSCSNKAKTSSTGNAATDDADLAAPGPAGEKGKSKTRRRRKKAPAQVPNTAGEVLALADGNADEETPLDVRSSSAGSQSRSTLRSHISASRSPKRSEPAAVPSAAKEEGAPDKGTLVELRSLQSRPELNGKLGAVQFRDENTGRVAVKVVTAGAGGEVVRVLTRNLSVLRKPGAG